ncbi:MAG TPA: DUF4380 domain-containing protein [Armatimonadetes bacterium]|nr:DUF4380 domain-containing protein [Armatimonadota bacterium]
MSRKFWLLLVGLWLVVGCGEETRQDAGLKRARAAAQAERVKYQDWEALRLKNALIAVVTVPAIGGRTMVYDLGTRSLLYTNPKEYGQVYPAAQTEGERVWHNWGGYKTWPAPQSHWGGPPDPLGSYLDAGEYKGEIVQAEGNQASVRVTSTADQDTTGLRFTRTLTVYRGTTRVKVEQTMTNISDKPVRWSIWDVTQVPGALGEGETFSDDARVYFPLNPQSRHQRGFEVQAGKADSEQWMPNLAPGIMGVKYLGERGKIGADSFGGWIAYADERHGYVYVKLFTPDPKAEYPDNGSTVEVYTNRAADGLPYLEVEVLSPLQDLEPGESYTFPEDWYAARCPGPVVAVNQVGVVSEPLRALKTGDSVELTGTFGVFHEGRANYAFYDAQGKLIERRGRIEVSPLEVWELKEVVVLPEGAVQVALEVENYARVPVGELTSTTIEEAAPAEETSPSETEKESEEETPLPAEPVQGEPPEKPTPAEGQSALPVQRS